MPGCSLREAFPGFVKDVNENPQLNTGVQRYGVEIFQPNTTIDSGPMIETFSPYTTEQNHDDNIGQFERVIPENIEKLLEDSTYGNFPDENKYLFDRIPQDSLVETDTNYDHSNGHLTEDIIRHLKNCSSCRKRLMLSTTVIRENIRPMDQMIELSTFLATGIFIILILDIMTKSQR
jgi:hypothetical protein